MQSEHVENVKERVVAIEYCSGNRDEMDEVDEMDESDKTGELDKIDESDKTGELDKIDESDKIDEIDEIQIKQIKQSQLPEIKTPKIEIKENTRKQRRLSRCQ